MVRASRPEALSGSHLQHLKSDDEKGHRAGMVSFLDIVARSPAPTLDEGLTKAREALMERIVPTGVERPDMCPPGHCQFEVNIGNTTSTVAVDQTENWMRLSSLRISAEDLGPPEYHPQFFIDVSEGTPTWGYLFVSHPDCKEDNLLFRGTLETEESDDSVLSSETVVDESGNFVETTKETTASTVITENPNGTTAQLEVLGSTPWKAQIRRNSLKSGCESSGCDTYFGLPKGTSVIDVAPEDYKLLLQYGKMPAGYCTPVGAGSELVQLTAGESLDRASSAFWSFFTKPLVSVARVVSKTVVSGVKTVAKTAVKTVHKAVKVVKKVTPPVWCFWWCR